MKTWKGFLFLTLALITLSLGVACGDNSSESGFESNSSAAESSITVSINKTSLTLYVDEEVQLTATASDGSDIVWMVEDPTIALIENGLVKGLKSGVTEITAVSGSASAVCTVTVVEDSRPLLVGATVNGEETNTINLLVGGTAVLDVALYLEGQRLTVPFTMTSNNNDIATINDGRLTAVSVGETSIDYSATYRNETFTGSFSVIVKDNSYIALSTKEVVLCAAEEADIPNSVVVEAQFMKGGEEIEGVQFNYEADDVTLVAIEGNKIIGLKEGTTKVAVSCTYKDKNYSAFIEVTIHLKQEILPNKVLLSKYDVGNRYTDGGFNIDSVESVTFKADGLVSVAEMGEGGFKISDIAVGYYDIEVVATGTRYIGQAVVADKVITTAEELAVWPSYVRPADWALNKANTYDGLVVLGANIDYNGAQYLNELQTYSANISDLHIAESGATTVSSENANIAAGYDSRFAGVFDGLGYTIHNITIGKVYAGGLFGYNFYGTVKNLAVTNIVMTPAGYAGTIANVFGGVAENIFLEGKMTRGTAPAAQGLFAGVGEAGKKLTNVVGILSEVCAEIPAGQRLGVLIGHDLDELTTNDINVYGISDKVATLTRYGGAKIASKSSVLEYAETSFEAFGEYWDTANGFPIFESAKGKLSTVILQAQKDGISTTAVTPGESIEIVTTATNASLSNAQLSYYTITTDVAGVTINDNILNLSLDVPVGTEIIVTATSILDDSVVTIKLQVV